MLWTYPSLFYIAETWAVKAKHVRRLRGFHNCCIWSMLEVSSRLQQWRGKRLHQENWQRLSE